MLPLRLRLYSGLIPLGRVADPVVFDEANVNGTVTFEKPLSCSVSFDYVLVNGQVVIDDERWTRKNNLSGSAGPESARPGSRTGVRA